MLSEQKILDDLKASMLAKDELRTSVLRMLKSEILNVQKSGGSQEINKELLVQMIKKMLKQRADSSEQFKKGGRMELAEREEAEMLILKAYLPEEMSEEQIKEVAQKTMAEMGVSGKSDMGRLMGTLMGKLKGQADGALVKKVVEQLLG